MDPMIAPIMVFAGNFAPRGWAYCDGQLLSISANTALFSLLGTIYGGDGRTTFALLDLRGRTPIGPRRGPGLSDYRLGERAGREVHTLTIPQMPTHNHTTTNTTSADQHVALSATSAVRNVPDAGDVPAAANYADGLATKTVNNFGPATGLVNGQTLSGNAGLTVNDTGGGVAHNNIQPFLAINYIIAMTGLYPSRN
ncbi:MAG: phage tail protein [Flavobacteriaceae bacterium]|nr:phage tail protein [Flavobacteriaceae bacterium]